MNLKIKKEDLLHLITPSQGLIEKRNVIPILSKTLLRYENQKLKVYATDQENSLQSYFDIKGKEGAVCVDSRNLFDIVKELPSGEIELEKSSKNHNLIIRTSSSYFTLMGVQPTDFPVFPNLENPTFFSLEAHHLLQLIQQTSYCVSQDETRYYLNGVLCEKKASCLKFVATDGHRLSFSDQKIDSKVSIPQGVIIPRRGLNEMSKLISGNKGGSVEIAIHPPRLLMRYQNFLLSIRLIEGKYPNYTQLIPKNSRYEFCVEKEILVRGLRRVSIMSSQQSRSVLFSFSKKKLVLEAKQPDQGSAKEEIPLVRGGGHIEIRFNARYILESLTHSVSEEQVLLKLSTSSAPGMIVSKSGVAIVMPMKL